ncbi:endonuclease III domain-containing protein [Paracoccus alkanivorans]|uniref:Iron-sulfur cluster loop n=1 Tax=Paracoccus alkanivorans TaxID=2116655 RepID=A0A3M0MKK5_9RHOB|nr:iron-sulfur cluster loop [Paracoccus alkanivorans]RMC36170.1 iron-sulfur cluster loop [Paracoccus alkanivorans]
MQYSLPFTSFNRLAAVHRCLTKAFGTPPEHLRLDPVSQMVLAMVSIRTRDEISGAAFLRLARHCGHWEALAQMAPDAIEPLLHGVTHPERKANALPRALREIIDRRGALTLDFLAGWPVGAAIDWLENLHGVGPKISAATLNLSTLQRRVLVVDTAHWRAARCLGLIPERADPGHAARMLNHLAPDEWGAADMARHYALMKRLGKTCCVQASPRSCPFFPLCATSRRSVSRQMRGKRLEDGLRAWASRHSSHSGHGRDIAPGGLS